MIKATFDSPQDAVKTTTLDGMTTVQLCLREAKEMVTPEEGEPYTQYIYDYHEWAEASPDIDTIKADPEKYLDYEPSKPTQEERIRNLEDTVDTLLVASLEG